MNKILAVSALALTFCFANNAFSQKTQGGFNGPALAPTTVAEALKLSDDTPVVLVGKIEKNLGHEKYLFNDASGSVIVEIDDDDWNGVNVTPADTIEIRGEVDKEMLKDTEIDAVYVSLKK